LFSEDYLQYFRRDLGALLTHSTRDARAGGDPLAWSRLTEAERMMEAVETGQGDHDGIGTVAQPFMWYARILDLARARHVRVIAARFPVHPGYAAQAPAAKVAEIDSFLLKAGVAQIIDLRDALTDPKDFGDPDHINEAGAAPLVKILEQKLQQPLILRQPAVVVQRFDR
jgi:lysophospholipase L1-like esterase